MIRLNNFHLLVLFLLFSTFTYSQDLFNRKNTEKFAKYLTSTKQYHLATLEYERILSFGTKDTVLFHRLIKNYRLGNNCEQSFFNLETLGFNNFLYNASVADEYLKLSLHCNCCFKQHDFSAALQSLNEEKKSFYKLSHYFFANKQDSLLQTISQHRSILELSYPMVLSTIYEINNFNPKKPEIAMLMSSILPGSGKAYAGGKWGDAIMSFVFVLTNAWLSYRGFNKNGIKSANGWIFGTMSFGFYIGNIWGSGQAVKTFNQQEYDKRYNETKNSIYNHF